MGIASLFGDEEAESPQDLSDEDLEAFKGTDLADVAACKLTLGKEWTSPRRICFGPIAARRT